MAQTLIGHGQRTKTVTRVEAKNRFEMRQCLRWATGELEDAGEHVSRKGGAGIERDCALRPIESGREIALRPHPPHAPQPLRQPLAVVAPDRLFGRLERSP